MVLARTVEHSALATEIREAARLQALEIAGLDAGMHISARASSD
jgi:hypothetical protein